jgi:hypothetical protein
MKRISLWGFALVMVLGLFSPSPPASAQQITGTGEDAAGAALNSAIVTARDTLDSKMKIGAVTNTVQASSEVPQLQAHTMQVRTLIDTNMIVGIPLATRNYVELTLLALGSVSPDNSTSQPF